MSNKKTVEKNTRLMIQELNEQIQKMIDDRNDKLKSAKTQLIESLKITADKYRTATGVMEALRVQRMVFGEDKPILLYSDDQVTSEMNFACNTAKDMVDEVNKLINKAEALGYGEMDRLCEDAYNKDFINDDSMTPDDLCLEIMRIDLCRNVGPAAEDMVSFLDRVQEEINATWTKLDELYKENPEIKEIEPPVKITEA